MSDVLKVAGKLINYAYIEEYNSLIEGRDDVTEVKIYKTTIV